MHFIFQNLAQRRSPKEWAKWWCSLGLDQDGFEARYINDYKGNGIYSHFKTRLTWIV